MNRIVKKLVLFLLVPLFTLSLASCGASASGREQNAAPQEEAMAAPVTESVSGSTTLTDGTASYEPASEANSLVEKASGNSVPVVVSAKTEETVSRGPELPGLVYERTMKRQYAEQFDVYYYEGGFKYIDSHYDGRGYLVVPEGKTAPKGLDSDIRILQQPIDDIYLVATASMALFDAMDSLDVIKLTSQDADGWYVENASDAMKRGEILFGGKYSEPDYELLVDSNIDIAIENTMILHTPKVIDMIEILGIPVFIENSSYETHPLGRVEWIKLFSALIDREDRAEAFFEQSVAKMEQVAAYPDTGKSVVIFLIDSTGRAQVRAPDDYLSKIISIAGGQNAFDEILADDESRRTNINMTMEEFYASAMDVDYFIYNASGYSSGVTSMKKLLEMSPLLADCKALREGNVWWLGPETYQRTDRIADLIGQVHSMLTGGEENMTFLHKME